MTNAANPPSPGIRRSALAAVTAGHAVEWYDFAAYAFLAPVIARVFFPTHEGSSGLLATFAVIAVAFFFRPLGGLIFGALGDRLGRRLILTTVILIMSVSTAAIGLLPTYATIGVWAPAILIVLRILQGLSAGGEFGGAATFVAESAAPSERGRAVSWVPAFSFVGQIAASLIVLALTWGLTAEQMDSWGWRIPFLLAFPAGITTLVMRLKLVETPVFRKLQESGELSERPLRDTVVHDRRAIAQTIGLVLLIGIGTYLITTYLAVYLATTAGLTTGEGLAIVTVSMGVIFLAIPRAGRLSDRVGRKVVMKNACAALAFCSVPMFLLMGMGSVLLAFIGAIVLGTVFSFYIGAAVPTITELFNDQRRYSGFSVGYNVSVAVFGGTASYVAAYLIDLTGSSIAPSFLLTAAAVIALLTVMTLSETAPARARLDLVEQQAAEVSATPPSTGR